MPGSKFENFDIGRKLAAILNIKGQKNQPDEMDVSQLRLVFDVATVLGNSTFFYPQWTGSIAGVTSADMTLVGSPVSFVAPTGDGTVPVAIAALSWMKVHAFQLSLSYNGAGAAADAGQISEMLVLLSKDTVVGSIGFPLVDDFNLVNAGVLGYQYCYPQGNTSQAAYGALAAVSKFGPGWNGWVPPQHSCRFEIARKPGTGNWPAATSVSASAIVEVLPVGVRPY